MAKFSERLKLLRKEHELSQAELARQIGTSKSSINMYERGEREPGIETLEAIADYFNVDMDYLLGKTDHRNKYEWLDGLVESRDTVHGTEDTVTIGIIGEVAAGYEHMAIENWASESAEIPRAWLHGRSASDFFALRVIHDSMYPLYMDGDIVIVLKQSTMNRSGEIGVVVYGDDKATLKKIEYVAGEDWMKLVPVNPEYAPKTITGEDLEHCRVLGVPKILIRDMGNS